MKARRTGLVVEWVVEEDARRILLSSPSGAGCERSIIGSCRSDGTRPGSWDGACPSPRSQLGMRAGDDGRGRRQSDGTRPGARDGAFPLLSLPVRDASRRRRSRETTERRHEAGRSGWSLPPPLTPSQGCEQETPITRDDEATARGRALGTELAPPLAPS